MFFLFAQILTVLGYPATFIAELVCGVQKGVPPALSDPSYPLTVASSNDPSELQRVAQVNAPRQAAEDAFWSVETPRRECVKEAMAVASVGMLAVSLLGMDDKNPLIKYSLAACGAAGLVTARSGGHITL